MKKTIITNKDRTRLAAIIGAEVIEPSTLWPRGNGDRQLVLIERDQIESPPLIEGAVIVVIDDIGGLDRPKWAAGVPIDPMGDAQKIRGNIESAAEFGLPAFRSFVDQWALLDDRERECLRLSCHGLFGQEVADEIGIKVRTVQTYMTRARSELDVPHIPRIAGLLQREELLNAKMSRQEREVWLARWSSLTGRQQEVAKMAMMMPEAEVAVRADLTKKTVGVHKGNVFRKLRGKLPAGEYSTIKMAADAAICGVHPEVAA